MITLPPFDLQRRRPPLRDLFTEDERAQLLAFHFATGTDAAALGRLYGLERTAMARQLRRAGRPAVVHADNSGACAHRACEVRAHARGLCRTHYERDRAGRDMDAPFRDRSGSWINRNGYRCLWIDGREVLEHRKVMEDVLGRTLYADETVHHRNGHRLDNRLRNLELWSSRHPAGQRVEDLLEWAQTIIARYG